MDANFVFIITLMFIAANLPFINEKLFAFITLSHLNDRAEVIKYKAIGWRLVELIIYYFIVGLIARMLESQMDDVANQTWQFYVVTVCLFLVFAFPGFSYRFLLKRG